MASTGGNLENLANALGYKTEDLKNITKEEFYSNAQEKGLIEEYSQNTELQTGDTVFMGKDSITPWTIVDTNEDGTYKMVKDGYTESNVRNGVFMEESVSLPEGANVLRSGNI